MKFIIFIFSFAIYSLAFAQAVKVAPIGAHKTFTPPIGQKAGDSSCLADPNCKLEMNFVVNCYGTNLRYVSEPLRQQANILTKVSFSKAGQIFDSYLSYPAALTSSTQFARVCSFDESSKIARCVFKAPSHEDYQKLDDEPKLETVEKEFKVTGWSDSPSKEELAQILSSGTYLTATATDGNGPTVTCKHMFSQFWTAYVLGVVPTDYYKDRIACTFTYDMPNMKDKVKVAKSADESVLQPYYGWGQTQVTTLTEKPLSLFSDSLINKGKVTHSNFFYRYMTNSGIDSLMPNDLFRNGELVANATEKLPQVNVAFYQEYYDILRYPCPPPPLPEPKCPYYNPYQCNAWKTSYAYQLEVQRIKQQQYYNQGHRMYQWCTKKAFFRRPLPAVEDKKEFIRKDGYKTLLLRYRLPAEAGFCGAFMSPLMLFFDDQRPRFLHESNFPLYKDKRSIFWPEANAPGYFLVHLKNKNEAITKRVQLFGGNQDYGVANGFEELRQHDSNNDRVIDKKDKEFKNLYLWQDKNGDGKSQKGEVISLATKGVISINLSYSTDQGKTYGHHALSRETSSFKFKTEKKIKEGIIEDVWLSPSRDPI